MGRNKIKGGQQWSPSPSASPTTSPTRQSKNQSKMETQSSTKNMSLHGDVKAAIETAYTKMGEKKITGKNIINYVWKDILKNAKKPKITSEMKIRWSASSSEFYTPARAMQLLIRSGLQLLNDGGNVGTTTIAKYVELPQNVKNIIEHVLNPVAKNITVLGQNLIPFEMKGGKIIMKASVASPAARRGTWRGDWRSAIIHAGGIGQHGGSTALAAVDRSAAAAAEALSGERITGQQAAEQGLALLLAKARENKGELTSEQMTQLERLAMIAHTAQRQNAEIDMTRRRECDIRFWKRCHEGVKYLTTILAGIAAYYILSMFGGLAGILTAGASGLIGLLFILVIGVFTTSINGVAGWFFSGPAVRPAGEILSNITATIMVDARMAPVMVAMKQFGWSTQIVAWIILFFILLALFHIPRIISQADSVWTPFGGVGSAPTPALALPPPAPVPRLEDQTGPRLRLPGIRRARIEDEDAAAVPLQDKKNRGGGKRRTRRRRTRRRRTRRRRKKRKSTRRRRRKNSRRRRKRKSRRRLHKKELRRIVTQARRFKMATSDRRYNRPGRWVKWSRPSRAKGRKKRSRRIYWRRASK